VIDIIIAVLLMLSGLIVFGILGSLYLLLLVFIPAHRLSPAARGICRLFLWSTGHTLKINGTPPNPKEGPYLYLFNHESMFDVFMLGAMIPEYFTSVGKASQFSWFFWGTLLKRYGAIPIKRRELTEAIHSLDKMEEAIGKGVTFIVSPEGTRSLTGKVGSFKKGPFHVALNTGITLVPLGIQGAFESKPKQDWKIRPGRLTLTIGEPIKFADYRGETVESLRDRIRAQILILSGRESEN